LIEFFREASCEALDSGRDLLVLYSVILLILAFALETLPGKGPLDEVNQDKTDRFEIVSAGLFYS